MHQLPSGLLFTDLAYHNVGIGVVDGKPTDVGRFTVTKEEKDTGAFKTPTLRDVARSAPYFHDGSVATLQEAVTLMVKGGVPNKFLDKTNLEPREAVGRADCRRRRVPELAHRADGTQGSESSVTLTGGVKTARYVADVAAGLQTRLIVPT